MLGAFACIGVFLLVLELLEYREGRETRRAIDLVQENALASVRLVGRIIADVDRERILIDRHIFEREQVDMDAIERQIAAVRADYDEAARQYTPLVMFPGEPAAWYQLSTDVVSMQHEVAPALAQSRQDHDLEAIQAILALDPLFEKIERDAATLLDINQDAARRAVADVNRVHRVNLRIRLALTAAILLFVVVAGLWVTRAVVFGQRQLLRLNRDLENRNRELDAFAGRVAHDLRGPLNTINLSAELIAARAPEAKDPTAAIGRGVQHIASLIDDLLLLSRIGSMPRKVAATESVATALSTDLGPLVEKAGGALRVALAPAQVACSDGLLRQALWNLGENAVKYRRSEVALEVEIAGSASGGRYVIRVSDNGVGMSADDVGHAFEPFFRGRATASIGGTGLGLAIVRRIVDACGGEITIDSRPGGGTIFVIALPLARISEPGAA